VILPPDPATGATGKERIIVDDGVFTDAWKVVGFDCFPKSGTGQDVQGLLSLDEDGLRGIWDASDNRQIAWSFMFIGTNGGTANSWIVPDHVVVRDLWIQNFSQDAMNYLIRVERQSLSDDQAILALIQERSQDDL
jgi:hypothetical protein